MKRLIASIVLSFASVGSVYADPVFGVWQTKVDGRGYAHVSMQACGTSICATVTQTFDPAGNPATTSPDTDLIGTQLVWDMQPKGQGRYRRGKIYQPSTKRTFASKMQLSGEILTVSGCVGPICERQDWARVSKP